MKISTKYFQAGFLLAILTSGGHAASQPGVDGETAVLNIYGSLTESPCRLEMSSTWQAVDMGNVAAGKLEKAGERGRAVPVALRLRDCQSVNGRNRDDRSGSLLWSHEQSGVQVRVTAPADSVNPQLFAVRGTSGLALRLKDAFGRDVLPGERSAPLLLNPGQDTLTWTLITERTSAPLRAGAWHALINIGLEYD
ncbi:TPA: type 1 fimbrial protein [Klebsiella aerogenes]|nr:type 1 fimbrial protein [Klebsiella aerogenes]